MKLYQRAGSDVWYVEFADRRQKRFRLSTEETDKDTASVRALEIMRSHLLDDLPDDARRALASSVSLTYALEKAWDKQWSKQRQAKGIRYRINMIEADVGHWHIQRITHNQLEGYVERLIEGGSAPATVNRKLSCIRVALTLAAKRGELQALPPFPYQTENNLKDRYLTREEESKFLAWVEARAEDVRCDKAADWRYFNLLLPILADTGLRVTEALTLTPSSLVRRPDGRAFVLLRHATRDNATTKSGKGRSVPLTGRALHHIEALLAHEGHSKGKDANWAGRKCRQVTTALDLPDVTMHILRHTCASRLVQGGMDLYRVQTWLGHADIGTTQRRYAHLSPDSLLDGPDILSPP